MRIFWSLIALLALATAAAFGLEGRGPTAAITPAANTEPIPLAIPERRPAPAPQPTPQPDPAPEPDPEPDPEPAAEPVELIATAPAAVIAPEPQPAPSPEPTIAAADPAEDIFADDPFAAAAERARQAVLELDALAPSAAEPAEYALQDDRDLVYTEADREPDAAPFVSPALVAEVAEATSPEPIGDVAQSEQDEADPAAAAAIPTEPALTINGRDIPGSGTAEDPYRLTWNAFASAERDYNPRQGKTDLPAWTTALDGKRITIDGYVLIPQTGYNGQGPVLAMQYQFDGCCIGIPPGPYNSAEVHLSGELDTSNFFHPVAYGTITGTFKADPYLIQQWLMGLYVLNDAEVTNIKPAGAF